MSGVSHVLARQGCLFYLLVILRQVCFGQERTKVCILVMISGGWNIDTSLVLVMFSETHVFSQVCCLSLFLEKVEGRKELRGESKEIKRVEVQI